VVDPGVADPDVADPGVDDQPVTDQHIRFHQSITFLPTRQAVPLARASEEAGYGGIYISDHLFNPRSLVSRYTYSLREDGAPGWEPETPWPDPMCVISALASVTEEMTFTTGVYIAPVRDLITVAKSVGTAAVLSDDRVRLGVGVGWCKEEFDQTGQEFASRGARLTEMIDALRALWQGGWVEFHGDYYDVPACMMEPAPSAAVPILGGGHSPVALRRTAAQCDGWIAAGAYAEEEAWTHLAALRAALAAVGRENDPFAIYMSLNERPDVDMYRRFVDAGVTDFVCAPWMFIRVEPGTPDDKALADRLGAVRWFADEFVAKV
jgi:probable F420-dependent oxidoreductase